MTFKILSTVERCNSTDSTVHIASMPPSYGARKYWNDRFANEKSFDWLLSTSKTSTIVLQQLQSFRSDNDIKILHIGSGNSELSHALPSIVGANGKVTNVDFSKRVIESARAQAEAQDGSRGAHEDGCSSEWVAADLLSADDIHEKLLSGIDARAHGSGWDLVVDKSTSDSISCGEDVSVSLPYPIRLQQQPEENRRSRLSDRTMLSSLDDTSQASIPPLHLLATHLAALAPRPRSRWLAFSYSAERFDILEASPNNRNKQHGPAAGVPDPCMLWRLRDKWSLDVSSEGSGSDEQGRKEDRIVHRPPELCWVYVLERTGVEVEWRKEC